MRRPLIDLRLLLSLVALVSTTGCNAIPGKEGGSSQSWFDRLPWFGKHDAAPEPYPNPVKLAVTWTPDTLIQAGRTPTRGFGGRLFFYNEKSQPVPVDGTLVVHGFDEQAKRPEETVKRFAFTPEQFTRHFSRSDLGASYSIWIPWDAVGGERRKISLVATFKSTSGKTVQGIPATVLLPGRSADPEKRLAERLSPQYRRWQQIAAGESPSTSGLTTTTIPRPQLPTSRPPRVEPPSSSGPLTRKPMIASGSSTPAVDVTPATQRPSKQRADVLPASARLPRR